MGTFSVVRLFGRLILAAVLPAAAVAAEQVQTRVSVTSQPSGATVVVDGQKRGTTPVTLFDLAPGRHRIKWQLAGYVESDCTFKMDEGPFIEKSAVLEEEKGLLLLKTDPEGCDIQIDGVSVGLSPRLITHLAAKDTYSVKLRKAGYQDQTINVKFNGRKPLVREEKLVLSSGTIDIQSEPSGAEVTVNGIVRGKTPVRVTEVPKGRATVKFHLDGFADEVRELAINPGDEQTLPIVLKGLPGTLHLESVPEGARFYVNGESRGKGPQTLAGLKPGEYEVRAELEGYGTVSETVKLANGESARREFRLSNVMGRIEVRTSPVGAELVFDGRRVGMTKADNPDAEYSDAFPIDNVLEGEHTLVIRKEGYVEATRHPKVQNSKTAQAKVRLKRIFTPNVEIVTARGTYKGVLVSNKPDTIVIEVRMGITQSFAKDEIRKITFLNKTEK